MCSTEIQHKHRLLSALRCWGGAPEIEILGEEGSGKRNDIPHWLIRSGVVKVEQLLSGSATFFTRGGGLDPSLLSFLQASLNQLLVLFRTGPYIFYTL